MEVGVFGVVTPTSVPILEVSSAVEAAGLAGLFLGEHFHLPIASKAVHTPTLPDFYKTLPDPMMLLAAAATVTSRIRLGTSISITPIHDPIQLATRIGTIEMLSEGRFVYGLGLGWNAAELRNHDVDLPTRRARVREQLRAMKALWSGETASFEGEHVRFTESWQGPKPTQRPHPPLLYGGAAGPTNFSLIADCCDGWMPASVYAQEQLVADLAELDRAVERVGRDPGSLSNVMLTVEHGMLHMPPEVLAEAVTPEFLDRYEKPAGP
jgi:probable F420-dependent oxidoreductase